jgi:hypothetical protein
MNKAVGFDLVAFVLLGFACGGTTTPSDDPGDGGADAARALDVTPDAVGDPIGGDAPSTWQRLTLDNGSGPCPSQISCSSSWVVTPDGHMAVTRVGDAGAAQMMPSDLIELDSIVSSAPFLMGMTNGFVCDRPPTDVFVNLRLDRDGASPTQGVTGCVFSGPMGNLPRRVNELVTKY